ncbi:MAG: Holliday junction ATP-dependent DNA helicase RuvB [Candidatus Azambacteria bacterium GW2011_GWC2_43_27]|nr:MAG: Holliday junction ATP-dependent DNA helicase RuvB [Candidatus Azambacteria bacterium GW2011_GWC2_43_27]
MENLNSTGSKLKPEDKTLDQALRPRAWDEYIGQDKVKANLKILLEAAKKRAEPIDHIVAREMGANIRITSGPAIEKVGDLASVLTNLNSGDILFIDEAHRLNKTIEEVLYPAMENRILHIIIGKGPSARTLQLDLPPFSLIAATTRVGLLSNPLRSRFGVTFRLDFYTQEDIENILKRSAALMSLSAEPDALRQIAISSRFTPRVANRLLKRVRDYAEVEGVGIITQEMTQKALALLEVDHLGLELTDRRLIEAIIKKFNGGPVGLQALAAATSEELDTIEDINEPYLLQIGFLQRTARGRIATKLAYEHLGFQLPPENQSLL